MNLQISNELSVDDYLYLVSTMGWKEPSKEQVKRGIEKAMYIVTMKDSGKTIGMARLVGDFGFRGLIADVIIAPEYRKKGIGKTLVKNIVEYVTNYLKDGERFLIELLPSAGSRDFYIKCGFKYRPEKMDGMYLWIEK